MIITIQNSYAQLLIKFNTLEKKMEKKIQDYRIIIDA